MFLSATWNIFVLFLYSQGFVRLVLTRVGTLIFVSCLQLRIGAFVIPKLSVSSGFEAELELMSVGYILNGNIHPNVQCDIGEEVNFYISAKNYPFSIWVSYYLGPKLIVRR